MTNAELNRDIKRLWNKQNKSLNTNNWTREDWKKYEEEAEEIQKEFKRLYFADSEATAMTYQSFKMMYRMNQKHRFIPLHTLFINIKL